MCTKECLPGQVLDGARCTYPVTESDCQHYFISLGEKMCIDAIVNGVYLTSDKLAMPVQQSTLVSEGKCVVDNTEIVSKESCA